MRDEPVDRSSDLFGRSSAAVLEGNRPTLGEGCNFIRTGRDGYRIRRSGAKKQRPRNTIRTPGRAKLRETVSNRDDYVAGAESELGKWLTPLRKLSLTVHRIFGYVCFTLRTAPDVLSGILSILSESSSGLSQYPSFRTCQ